MLFTLHVSIKYTIITVLREVYHNAIVAIYYLVCVNTNTKCTTNGDLRNEWSQELYTTAMAILSLNTKVKQQKT